MALDNLTPDRFQQVIINMSAERTAIVKGVAGSGKQNKYPQKRSHTLLLFTQNL